MEASMTIGGDDGGDGAVKVSISIPAGQQVAPNRNQDVRFLAQSMETIGEEIPTVPTTQRVIGQVFIPIVKNEEFELTSIINQGSDIDPILVQQVLAKSMETIGEEIPTIQAVVENEQVELIIQGSDVDSALTILTEPDGGSQITELQGYTDPRDIAYLLATYISLILFIVGKFALGKQGLILSRANPLVIISVAAYAMAVLNLIILAFMYDVLENSSEQQYFPTSLYLITKLTYYILCFLAHVLLVPMIFISHDH